MITDTAIVLIDPYNDFLHEDGKLYAMVADSLKKTNTIANMHLLIQTARASEIPIFYGLHQQWKEDIFKKWQMMSHSQKGLDKNHVFEEGAWGSEFFEGMQPGKGDAVVSKHWSSSSFHNTDLDYRLRQRGIRNVVLAGLVAETCFESTARYAYELGYNVTLLSDVTAGFNHSAKEAIETMVWPLFSNRVLKISQWVEEIEADDGKNHKL